MQVVTYLHNRFYEIVSEKDGGKQI